MRSKAYELIRSLDAEQRKEVQWWLSGKQAELLPFFKGFLQHIKEDARPRRGQTDPDDSWQHSIWAYAYGSGVKTFTLAAFNTRQSRLLDELLEYLSWYQLNRNQVRKRLLLIEYLVSSRLDVQLDREVRALDQLLGDPLQTSAMQPGTEAPLDLQSYQGRYELEKWRRQIQLMHGALLNDHMLELGAAYYLNELLFFACFWQHRREVAKANQKGPQPSALQISLDGIRALCSEPYFDALCREHPMTGWLARLLHWLEQPRNAAASEAEIQDLKALLDMLIGWLRQDLISSPAAQNLLSLCRWHCKQRYNATQAFPYIRLAWEMFIAAREHDLLHMGDKIPEPALYGMLNIWRDYKAMAKANEEEMHELLDRLGAAADPARKYFTIHLAFDAGNFEQALAYIREVQSSTGWPHASLEFNAGSVGLKAEWELHKPQRKRAGHPDPEHFRLEVNRLMTYVHNHQAELASYHKDFLHAFRSLASLRTHAIPGFRNRLQEWELRPDDQKWFLNQADWLETL
ncbi:MAG: hypothetical protein NW241_03575 [Bacteroidia bacterium]|nr:hypothetical protein [Bacteroidia bacterium]